MVLCWLTGPAWAQGAFEAGPGIDKAPHQKEINLTCRFSLECFEGEACAETDYSFELNGLAGGLAPDAMAALVKMESIGGSEDMLGTVSGKVMTLTGGGIEARHMLTLQGAAARYTLHYSDGPMVISYIGVCDG